MATTRRARDRDNASLDAILRDHWHEIGTADLEPGDIVLEGRRQDLGMGSDAAHLLVIISKPEDGYGKVAYWDPDGNLDRTNQRLQSMMGFDDEDMKHVPRHRFESDDDSPYEFDSWGADTFWRYH